MVEIDEANADAGEALSVRQQDVRLDGHAMEARLYSEDPHAGFLPSTGTVTALHEPEGPGLRIDSALRPGLVVGSDYDPMLAKVIAHGADREQARRRLAAALHRLVVHGLRTNAGYLHTLINDPDVVAGRLDTGLVERRLAEHTAVEIGSPVEVVAALVLDVLREPGGGAWRSDGWRLGVYAAWEYRLDIDAGEPLTARVDDQQVQVAGTVHRARLRQTGQTHGVANLVGGSTQVTWSGGPDDLWVTVDGRTARVRRLARFDATGAAGSGDSEVTSPMPGAVAAVLVDDGAQVATGDPVVVVEAMKMEHLLTAPCAGVVQVNVVAGSKVAADDVLATVIPEEEP